MSDILRIHSERDFSQSRTLSPKERAKTPQELSIIHSILRAMYPFYAQYGAASLPITPNMIHLMQESEDLLIAGEFDPIKNRIDLNDNNTHNIQNPNYLAFAHRLSHELTHFFAYQVYSEDEQRNISLRRCGLRFIVEDKRITSLFDKLNEATTEQFNKTFFRYFIERTKNPIIKDALQEWDNSLINAYNNILLGPFDLHDIAYFSNGEPVSFGYLSDRVVLQALWTAIYSRNINHIPNRRYVSNMFGRAYFAGQILDLARRVEGTFGKGNFRSMYSLGLNLL